jgi:hypothetical protein
LVFQLELDPNVKRIRPLERDRIFPTVSPLKIKATVKPVTVSSSQFKIYKFIKSAPSPDWKLIYKSVQYCTVYCTVLCCLAIRYVTIKTQA